MNRLLSVGIPILIVIVAAVAVVIIAANSLERQGYMLEPAHGTLIGEVDGVTIHYHVEGPDRRGKFGLEFECVEFVNRWLFAHIRRNLEKTGNALSYFTAARAKGLVPFVNDGDVKPERGDVIVFSSTAQPNGHVGIVLKVEDDAVEVAQQNATFRIGPFVKPMPIERFSLRNDKGKWNVVARRPLTCMGWSRVKK